MIPRHSPDPGHAGYPACMRLFSRLATFVLLLCASAPAFAAATVERVVIEGLDDELMAENVRLALALNDSLGRLAGRVAAGIPAQ